MADGQPHRLFPTGLTMLRAIAAARWLTWLWMVGVVAVADLRGVDTPLPDDPSGPDTAFRHPIAAWICVGAVLVMCVLGTVGIRRAPQRLMGAAFAVAEGALALTLSVLDGWVFDPGHVFETSQSLATQYPLIAMATLGLAFGPWVAAGIGALVGPAELWAARLNEFSGWSAQNTFSIVATSVFFAAAGALFGWQSTLLRRVEGEIADRRAKDEVARVMHDTVLQTLALVEKRTIATDPELAEAARSADRDVRRFLFGATSRETHTLESRIRSTVERATAHHDVDVTINVLDDGCRASPAAQNALAGAVGEAVTNAIKHAVASNIVVFAETDDDGEVFATVRDDGMGFDTTRVDNGEGLDGSIRERMLDAGGRAEVISTVGSGTEVRLWTGAQR
jgi:signal transduction histidine kinase